MSLGALTHRHRQMRGGLKSLGLFVLSSRGAAAMRMTADFTSEMRRITQGYNCLKKHASAKSELRHGLIKSITMWKVRRLFLALRTLCQWVAHRRQKRSMLLEARSCYEQEVKKGACRLFITAAAHHMRDDQENRIRIIAVKAARKWRSVVCRNKVMRSRGINPSTLTPTPTLTLSPSLCFSPSLSNGTERTSYPPTPLTPLTPASYRDGHRISSGNVSNLLRAKPRYLDSAEHSITPPKGSRSQVEVEVVPTPTVGLDFMKGSCDLSLMKCTSKSTCHCSPSTATFNRSPALAAPLISLRANLSGITDPGSISKQSPQGLAYAAPRRLSVHNVEISSPRIIKLSEENGPYFDNNEKKIDPGLGNVLGMKRKTRRKNKELLAQEILTFISEVRGAR